MIYTGRSCETLPRPPSEEGSLKSIVGSSSSGPASSVPPAIPDDGTLELRVWTGRIAAGSPCHLNEQTDGDKKNITLKERSCYLL